MVEYRVELKRTAARELELLEPVLAKRVLAALQALTAQPRPRQFRKLTGSENSYRLRVGAYRVLYQIDDRQRLVVVYALGHRREIYR